MKLRKVQILVAFGVLAVMSGGASLAWACTPQPRDFKLSASSGGVGDTVQVTGRDFDGRVEVRWNAIDGPLLARASTPEIDVTATIPAVPKGVYTITAIVWDRDGEVHQRAWASFQVTRSDVVDDGTDEAPEPPDPGDNATPPPDPGDNVTPPPATDDPVIEPEPVTPAEPAQPVADAPPAPAPRVAADPASVVDRSPDPASVTPQRRPVAPAPAAIPEPVSAPAPVGPSALAVSGDLWSGFDSGSGSLSGAETFGTGTRTTDNTGMTAGVVLLVVGLLVLGLAGTCAAVARRRAVATGDSDSRSPI